LSAIFVRENSRQEAVCAICGEFSELSLMLAVMIKSGYGKAILLLLANILIDLPKMTYKGCNLEPL
jgi:hypothetical protein